MQIYHDGSNSYLTNSQGALKLATETSGIAVTIGHTTSETTVADNLTVTGDFNAGNFKVAGANFSNSVLVGHTSTGTLSSADRNVGMGFYSFSALTQADDSVAIGYRAARDLTSGAQNTAVGASALRENLTSVGNVAMGYQALKVTTGAYNIGIGNTSGDNITSGAGNVIIGDVAAASATGDRQLMITGYDGTTTTTWIQGESTGNTEVAVNWNPSLSTTGKAFVMGF